MRALTFGDISTVLSWLMSAINTLHVSSILAAIATTYLACQPIIAFVRRGWAIKRDDVLSSLDDEAKKLYLKTFLKLNSTTPARDFDEMYAHRYGRYRLIVPTILFVLILVPTTYLLAETALAHFTVVDCNSKTCVAGKFLTLPPKAAAALAGAYAWVVFGLISNAARYNLPPPLVLTSILRIVVAAPLGYAVGALANPGLGAFLAFSIGAFPLAAVQTLLQRIATKQLKLDISTDPTGATDDQVTKLSGVDPPTADRLQDADITTIPQLAYCDPVQLSMRTNLGFDAVADLVDQALAFIYFEEKVKAIRPYGLRGAMGILNLTIDLNSADPAVKDRAEKVFAACATATGLDPNGLRQAFDEIAGDPYAQFLSEIW